MALITWAPESSTTWAGHVGTRQLFAIMQITSKADNTVRYHATSYAGASTYSNSPDLAACQAWCERVLESYLESLGLLQYVSWQSVNDAFPAIHPTDVPARFMSDALLITYDPSRLTAHTVGRYMVDGTVQRWVTQGPYHVWDEVTGVTHWRKL